MADHAASTRAQGATDELTKDGGAQGSDRDEMPVVAAVLVVQVQVLLLLQVLVLAAPPIGRSLPPSHEKRRERTALSASRRRAQHISASHLKTDPTAPRVAGPLSNRLTLATSFRLRVRRGA